MTHHNTLQERLDRILSAPRGEAPSARAHRTERSFSAYVDTDVEAAAALAKRFSTIIAREADPETGVQRALEAAEDELARETIGGTVQYALKLLLTHDKTARRHLSLRALEKRQPNVIRSENEEE